jgi:hypothetical protein
VYHHAKLLVGLLLLKMLLLRFIYIVACKNVFLLVDFAVLELEPRACSS